MTINNLLLKQSKGTMLEGLAQSFVRQPFQDLSNTPKNKASIIALLIAMVVLFVIMVCAVPYGIFVFALLLGQSDKSAGSAILIVYVILLFTYLGYALQIILAVLVFIIALIVALFV